MRVQRIKGNIVLYLIFATGILTVLGGGIFYLTTTSTFSGLGSGAHAQARLLAEAGIRYFLSNQRTMHNPSSQEFFLKSQGGAITDQFLLEIGDDPEKPGNIKVTSTGVSHPGTPYQASHRMILSILREQYQASGSAPFSFAGTESRGIAALAAPAGKSNETGVFIDTETEKTPKILLGMGKTGTYGCVWYQGWAHSNGSDCLAGRCNFNRGIRAYFDFQYNTPWEADGFTFSLVSAHNSGTDAAPQYINRVTDCGGGACGEYMGYAGPGAAGHGLQPPKIAVEFDPHIAGSSDVCLAWLNQAQCSSRRDNQFASPQKHAAFSYWGTNDEECNPPSNTYDDNRHGRGDGTNNPKNPEAGDTNPDGTTRPYILQEFDTFGSAIASPAGRRLSWRIEIDRVDDATSPDDRKYKLRAWLKPYAELQDEHGVTYYVCKDANGVTFDDTSRKFNNNNDHPPDFQQTVMLNQDWHGKFDRILFGWTQGTGGLTQSISIRNFKIDFKNKNDF